MVETDAFGMASTPGTEWHLRPAQVELIMEQEAQHPPDSRVWDDRATEVIEEARKMPLGERQRAALREAGRLRIAAEKPMAGN
jgi:hypothetical protein